MQAISPSRASSEPPLELRGGLGAGAMLSHQRAESYGTSILLEAHPAVRLADPLAAELAVSTWSFPGKNSSGRATLWGAGLRFDPRLNQHLRLFLDGHAGVGLTGPSTRFMFDGGGGLEYAFSDLLSLGLFGRYGQLADSHTDPRFAAGGAFLGLTWPKEEPPSPTLHSEPPAAPLRSNGSTGSGMSDAGVGLATDGGAPDGMIAVRDATADDVAP